MSWPAFAWGLVLIAAGMFIAVYGTVLFRFAVAAMGFGLGFLVALNLLHGQDLTVRVLISFAVGGVAAIVLYSLVRFGLHIAGVILGVVVGVLVSGLLAALGLGLPGWLVTVVVLVGAGGGGFLAPRFGDLVILLASAGAGALMIVNGLHALYADQIRGDPTDTVISIAQQLNLIVFAILFAISFLAQRNYVVVRRVVR